MDGASKFVRGDAVAGILILIINIVGGLAIGMGQHDLDLSTAMRFYALLTIGDGLVAQLPSLLLSTSAAILVTGVSSAEDLAARVNSQLLNNLRALAITARSCCLLGMIPVCRTWCSCCSVAHGGGLAGMVAKRGQEQKAETAAADQVVPGGVRRGRGTDLAGTCIRST